MLVLRRQEGDWTRITHAATGDVLPVRVSQVSWQDGVAHVELAFDDPSRTFTIERPESRSPRRRHEPRPAPIDPSPPG